MILAIDVHYKENYAKNVGIIFDWLDSEPQDIIETKRTRVEEYVPGEFYKRELPCLLDIVDEIDLKTIDAIIVDGHVYIDNEHNFGLGGHLWKSLNGKIPVIGVAKRAFHKNEQTNKAILRGMSKTPLYVSSIGTDLEEAAAHIISMKGKYRMPTILQILDTETKKS